MVEVLASGRTADVVAVDTDTVLRRYRVDIDAAREATVMTHVRSHGFPVPAVHRADRSEIEMERLHGPTMRRSLLDGHLPVGDAAAPIAQPAHDLLWSLVTCVGGVDADALRRVAVRRRADPMMNPEELDRLSAAAALVRTSSHLKTDGANSRSRV